MTRRLVAGALLVAAIVLGWAAVARLGRLRTMPQRADSYAILLLLTPVAAGFAGMLSRRADPSDPALPDLSTGTLSRCGVLRSTILAVLVFAIAATWRLQSPLRPPPPVVLAAWATALVAVPLAFPSSAGPRRSGARKTSPAMLAGIAVVVAMAFWARLAGLEEVPAVMGGDEINQVVDGRAWLTGADRMDPFGTGWGGTVRLGMLPAGAGYLWSGTPIAGPRVPYALAGALSVAGAVAVGWLVAGPWAALGSGALLALAPHHLHFSRLASVQILDSFFAVAALALLLAAWGRGSPRTAAFAGVASGLSLYGYAGGRIVPVVLAAAGIAFLFARRWSLARRAWLALALVAGFAVSAGPNLRFAVNHFPEWNARFNQVSIFNRDWFAAETRTLGSPSKVVLNQLKSGTIGLLSVPDTTPWFTGHPLVGPAILVGGALAGLGWLIGRGRLFPATLVGLVFAGNLAGLVLTNGSPAAQRASSLMPALAVLAGAAFAGLLSFVPERVGRVSARGAAGALAAGALLATEIRGYPLHSDPYARYGGSHAGFVQSLAELLETPRFRGHPIHLHGLFMMNSTFPTVPYLLPAVRFTDDPPERMEFTAESFPPGIHAFSSEWVESAESWRKRLGIPHAIRLAHPSLPAEDAGYVFVVPPASALSPSS
jgi:hypothetical protein